jgi:signal-transduction protein with cAMP-binding, CBS, and nucleotidyltransferase domain
MTLHPSSAPADGRSALASDYAGRRRPTRSAVTETSPPRDRRDTSRVSDAMVTVPVTHDRDATIGEVRRLLSDEHVHIALVVDGRRLLTAIERTELNHELRDDRPARGIGFLDGRTVPPDAPLREVMESMRGVERRRLAVTSEDGELLGLLCLKATGLGFCSDADVESRKRERENTNPPAQPAPG